MSNELAELPAEIETPVATDEAAPESTVTSAAENADAPTEGDKPDDTAEKKEPSEAEKSDTQCRSALINCSRNALRLKDAQGKPRKS